MDLEPWMPTLKDDGRIYGRGAAAARAAWVSTSARFGSSTVSRRARSG